MKRSSSLSRGCLLAAEKIYFWFGRGRASLLPYLLGKLSCRDLLLSHHCDLFKIPRIPRQVEQLPLYGFRIRKPSSEKWKLGSTRKEKIDLSENQGEADPHVSRSAFQTQCWVDQKTPYIACDAPWVGNGFKPTEIFTCCLKEHSLATRKLRIIQKKQHFHQKHRTFTPFNPQESDLPPSCDRELWEEMLRTKERPIFQHASIP